MPRRCRQPCPLPPDKRKIVTNHDAFAYYIDRYSITFVGSISPSTSTDAQSSAEDVGTLIEKIKAEHVKAIFLESSINPQRARQIGADAGVEVVDTLYGDSLGDKGTPGARRDLRRDDVLSPPNAVALVARLRLALRSSCCSAFVCHH